MTDHDKPYIIYTKPHGPFVATVIGTGFDLLESHFNEIKKDLISMKERIREESGAVIFDNLIFQSDINSLNRFTLLAYNKHILTGDLYIGNYKYAVNWTEIYDHANWFHINNMKKGYLPKNTLCQLNALYNDFNIWRCKECKNNWKDKYDFEDLCPFCESENIYINLPKHTNWVDLARDIGYYDEDELRHVTSRLSHEELQNICVKAMSVFRQNNAGTMDESRVLSSFNHNNRLDNLYETIKESVNTKQLRLFPRSEHEW